MNKNVYEKKKAFYLLYFLLTFGTFSIHAQVETFMTNQGATNSLAQCEGFFFDDGGTTQPYGDSSAKTDILTFCPENPAQQSVKVVFQSFDVAPGDQLRAFDGQDTLARQFTTSSQGTGTGASVADSPGGGNGVKASCDNLSGCVTFAFYRNGDQTKGAGWQATVECANKTTTKLDCSRVEDFNGRAGRHIAVAECEDGKAFIRVPIPSFTDCGRLGRMSVSSSCIADFPSNVVAIGTGFVETYFPIGEHTITFASEDFPELNCTANIKVISPGMGCNDNLNVSLTNECVVAVTPDMMLEGDCLPAYLTRPADGAQVPAFFYEVEMSAGQGSEVIGYTLEGYPMVDFSNVACDTRFDVKITRKYIADTDCDGQLFDGLNLDDEPISDFCWGQIIIEDKTAPRILDSPDPIAIPCYEKNEDPTKLLQSLNNIDRNLQGSGGELNLPLSNTSIQIEGKEALDVFENCYFEVTASSWEFVAADCEEENENITDVFGNEIEASIFGFYRRVFSAKDRCNNEALEAQVIYVYQPDIAAAAPEIEVPCGVDIDPNSLRGEWLAWVEAGRPNNDPRQFYASFLPNFDPTFISFDWYEITDGSGDEVPLDVSSTDCGYAVDWSDSDTIYVCGGGFKIFRTWTIYDWCDGVLELTNVVPQVIQVGDKVAPEILGNTTYEVASSPQLNCSINIRFFKPVAQDDCAGVVDLSVSVAGQSKRFLGNSVVIEGIPIGEELTIEWSAKDACGNTSTVTEDKIFKDEVAPVAVCETLRTVSLGSECTTVVPAESFDDGSFDNCGTVNFSVARTLPVGFPEEEDFQPFVELTADDLGENCNGRIEVLFRVMDRDSNVNYCTVAIELQDKLPPFNQPIAETIDCNDPSVDEILQINAIENTADRLEAFSNFLMTTEGIGAFSGTDNCSGADQMTIVVLNADFGRLDGTCRSGTIRYTYRLIDGCGNGSSLANNTLTINASSDWVMSFPTDLELFCEDASTTPAASSVEDILTNNGCDFWGMEVHEARFEDATDACYKIVYTYQFINWCNWSPNNTEMAIVERPDELITDPIHTVSLRFQDFWNNDLVASGDCTSAAANTPDGINDIDDGNEDFDFEAGIYGSSCPSSDPILIYNAFDLNRDRSASYEETRSGIAAQNEAMIPLRVFDRSVNRDRSEGEIINDDDEAANFDVYDVTESKIDGDFVVIDTGDRPYGDVPTYSFTSQFSNVVQTYVSAQRYGNIAYRQTVKVIDTAAPTVEVENFAAFCGGEEQTNSGEACSAAVDVKFSVSDVCSDLEDIQVSYTLKAFGGNTTSDAFGDLVNEGNGRFSIQGTYPLAANGEAATHIFVVRIEDGCSNSEVVEIPFEVKDCKAPVVYCKQGLSASMSETGEVVLWASDFDAGSLDFCTPKDELKYTFADPSIYPDSTNRTFLCERGEVGENIFVRFWVQDLAGNSAFCETFVKITPFSTSGCNGENLAQITGLILTEEDGSVQDAEVMLSGGARDMRMTNDNGGYHFEAVEIGYDYSITPSKDNNHLEGISTFDLIIISKHILNVERLDSPYKILAADVNNSGTVTTNDMIALRKIILGQADGFPNNTSWRFIPRDYIFPNVNNPWTEDFPESLNFNDIEEDMEEGDFVGIKVGDVNGSVNSFAGEIEGRSTVKISTTNHQLKKGESYQLPLNLNYAVNVEGLQMTFTFDPKFLRLMSIEEGLLSQAHFGTSRLEEGILLISWTNAQGQQVSTQNILANLNFEALKATDIEQVIKIKNDALRSEAYLIDGSKANLNLAFNTEISAYQLHQNEPNPFSENTAIRFDLPQSETVHLRIYSTTGQIVFELEENFEAGEQSININQQIFEESGVYYYQLNAAEFSSTKKMILLK
ncbi:MAG: T9SS type A sorting domain-containing protein [Bacteroidota bacterium]